MQNNNNNNKNGRLIIILLIVVTILVLFFPKIYDLINGLMMPKVEQVEIKEEETQEKEVDESILETIHYPIMRTSVYDSNTYYSLDKFTIKDLSNNDILLNAFLDMYEGNMTNYEGVSACTTISKQFSQDYLILRIKNILGVKTTYTLQNFYVPEDSNSKYVGNWNYDSLVGRFVYVGLCSSKATSTKYYNLEELIDIKYDNNDIVVRYYVGFAKVEGTKYTIYKDAKMTKEISTGTFSNVDELNQAYKNIDKKNKEIYKYIFKNTLCSYNEYCLYEGKWENV